MFSFEQHNIGVFAQLTFVLLAASLCQEKGWKPFFHVANKNLRDTRRQANWLDDFIVQKHIGEDARSEAEDRLASGDAYVFRSRYDLNKLARGRPTYELQNELRTISRATELFERYFELRPFIGDIAQDFIAKTFGDQPFTSVHFRGLDKLESEARISSTQKIYDAIANHAGNGPIFVATDSLEFQESCKTIFGDQVHFFHRPSGIGHLKERGDNYKKSLDAFVDCVILSRGKVLIKTPSQLSTWSKILNPGLDLVLAGQPIWQPHGEIHLTGAGYWPESDLFDSAPEALERNRVLEMIR